MSSSNINSTPRSQALSLFFGGILPVIAFTLIEEYYGTIAGLIAGMVFGTGEIIYEFWKYRKVSGLTWFGNGMLLGMGALSLWTNEGIWFKLQPAIMEGVFAFALSFSFFIKKPLLKWLMEQQKQEIPPALAPHLNGMTLRLGLFFGIHAAIATWAALSWTTTSWALLKGVGLTVSFIIYMILEMLFIRRSLLKPE